MPRVLAAGEGTSLLQGDRLIGFSEARLPMAKATALTSKQKTIAVAADHSTMLSDRPTTAPSPRLPAHRTGVPLLPRAPLGLRRATSWTRSARAGRACEASRRRRPPPPLCAPRAVSHLLRAHLGNRLRPDARGDA